jgi:molecular chaperone DnaK (HSP70)
MLAVLLGFVAPGPLIGFDIGTDTIKAAVLRSGRSIEMVLNEQSKRNTPGLVSFEGDVPITPENVRRIDRRIGVAASPVMQRNRSAVIRSFPDILGRAWSPELQDHFSRRFLDFNMTGTSVNGVEPHVALGMILQKLAKQGAMQLQQGSIRDAVVAVPAFFTNVQRIKVASAVKLAGLNLLRIIDEKHALSLVYAVEKTHFFTREPRTVAIVDFGHGSLKIGGYKFSAKIITQKGRNPRPLPKVEELGYAWDDRIGGMDIDICLARWLSERYKAPIGNLLLEDAQKLKHALTLGDPANVSLDSVNDRIIFTRDNFSEICQGIFDKIRGLARSLNMTFDSVEFVGGSSRIPLFQDVISAILGPASRALNNDESVVTGAAYTAAMASGSFKLMDVNHESSNVHAANLTFGAKEVRLFSEGSSLTKLKTARFDASDARTLSLSYVSRLPVGADPLIHRWEILHDGEFPGISRVVLSFGFNAKSAVELSKSQLYVKSDQGEVTQTPLDVRGSYRPFKIQKDDRLNHKLLLSAFSANDARLARIAEARNNLEAQIFELKDAITRDTVWTQVMSAAEKVEVNQIVNNTATWADEDHDFEDEAELKDKSRLLEEAVKGIRFRVEESRTRESSIQELQYLLSDMQDAVLNRWPAKRLRVPKREKKAILDRVRQTREWLDRKIEEQRELDPWEDPVLKTSDLTLRIKKLGDAFKTVEEGALTNKLKSRRDEDNEDDFGADL